MSAALRLRDRRDDRGITLVLAALTLVTLLVFSAFAIDVGAVYNERRQDQTAADSAVLAAASPSVIANDELVLDEVLDRLNANTRSTFVRADLNTCGADAGALPVLASVDGSTYDCVSFNAARTEVRVRVPPRDYNTFFAHLVGVETMGHSAFAIGGTNRGEFGGVLPFGITGGTGTGHVCIKTGSHGLAIEPCEGSTSGNFGFLNFAHFGSPSLGTPVSCVGGGTNRIAPNLAMGVDHSLSLYGRNPHNNTVVVDTGTPCGSIASPNAAQTATGNIPNILGDGIYSGSNFYDNGPARLRRQAQNPPPYFQWTNFGSYTLDDNPLWSFIEPSLSLTDDVPTSCMIDQFVAPTGGLGTMSAVPESVRAHLQGRSTNEQMRLLLERCFAHYQSGSWAHEGFTELANGCGTYPCTDPVFSRSTEPGLADIQQTPRFGYVPVLVETSFPSGSSSVVRFDRFRAIFIQRVALGQGANNVIEFDPGVGMGAGSHGDTRSQGFTAFAFPDSMLPDGLGSDAAPMNPANQPVRLLR